MEGFWRECVRFDGENATWLVKLCGMESIALEKLNTQEMDTRVKNPKCDSSTQQIENFWKRTFLFRSPGICYL